MRRPTVSNGCGSSIGRGRRVPHAQCAAPVHIVGAQWTALAFARALGWVMDRHEVLRTLLCEENAGASQRIVQEYTLPLQEVDLRALPEPY